MNYPQQATGYQSEYIKSPQGAGIKPLSASGGLNRKEEANMKLGKILIVVGLIAAGILSLNFQAQAGNPATATSVIEGNEYWGVLIIACDSQEVSLRVKRVVNCLVEIDSVIERYPAPICPVAPAADLTANALLDPPQWIGYNGVIFNEPGVPIITKVKNFHKKDYEGGTGKYDGDIYSADVQIRFCSNCAGN
jgi:hypothetical protein